MACIGWPTDLGRSLSGGGASPEQDAGVFELGSRALAGRGPARRDRLVHMAAAGLELQAGLFALGGHAGPPAQSHRDHQCDVGAFVADADTVIAAIAKQSLRHQINQGVELYNAEQARWFGAAPAHAALLGLYFLPVVPEQVTVELVKSTQA